MGHLTTIKYNGNENEWDNFVFSSRNGTLFHTQRFLSYHRRRFENHSLMFKKKEELSCVFPATVVKRDHKKVLFSHAGSSFGGPIVSSRVGIEEVDEIIIEIVEYAKSISCDEIEMRLPPYIYYRLPCDEIQYCLYKNGFILSAKDLSCVITLNHFLYVEDSTNRSIRKAINSDLRISYTSPDLEKFWDILENNLKTKHNVKPTHTIDEIYAIKKLFPDRIRLIAAYLEKEMTAGIVLFLGNELAFEVFYIAQNYDFQEYRCMNLLIHYVTDWGYANNFKYVNLGISTENGGKDINWGLFRFKQGFGANCVLRPSFMKVIK